MWQNFKTQIWQNFKSDSSKPQNVTELKRKKNVTKPKKSKCDKTLKLKIWQNSKTPNLTKLKNSKSDMNWKTQN